LCIEQFKHLSEHFLGLNSVREEPVDFRVTSKEWISSAVTQEILRCGSLANETELLKVAKIRQSALVHQVPTKTSCRAAAHQVNHPARGLTRIVGICAPEGFQILTGKRVGIAVAEPANKVDVNCG